MKALGFFAALLLPWVTLAEVKMKTIEYKDGDVACKGVLIYPDGAATTPRPGVLVIPEWWGINDYVKGRGKMLAELGYVAFVADMYGDAKVVTEAKDAQALAMPLLGDRKKLRARAEAALEAFKRSGVEAELNVGQLAAIGYCFGGTTVLEMARGGAELSGVVSFHGILAMPDPAPAPAIKAKVLVCHGADDPMVPPEQVNGFVEELKKAKADYQVNIYANSLHAFTNPDADKAKLDGVAYNKQADQRSWAALKDFLKEVFGQ